MNFADPSGLFLDTIFDVGFIGYDVHRIAKGNVFGSCDNPGTDQAAEGLAVFAE